MKGSSLWSGGRFGRRALAPRSPERSAVESAAAPQTRAFLLAISLLLTLGVAAQRLPGQGQRQQTPREQALPKRPPPPANGCALAVDLANEVKAMYASAVIDHVKVMAHVRTIKDYCPGVDHGMSPYGYCSALAVGERDKAERFKQGNRGVVPDCGRLAPASLPAVREKFALVIGVGTFRDKTIPPLKFAAKDATDFARALTKHGGFAPQNVTLLTDEQATRAGILGAIQQLILLAHDDDLVVLFVSSHGSPRREEQGLGGAGHIVTYDTSSTELWTDAIEYEEFASKTSRIKARRKVAFLDTCYSGQAMRPGSRGLTIEHAGVDDRTARLFLSGEGTAVITSSKSTERSWESDTLQRLFHVLRRRRVQTLE